MSLFMTLLVRDEEDILDANLRHHLEQGVDHVIVTDNLSVDSSADIVRSYVDQGVATYLYEPEDTYAQSHWVTRMARMAHQAGAGWVVHSDADEFWMPPRGVSLAGWFSRQWWPNVVVAPRHDFVCVEGGEDEPFWRHMIYRKTTSTNPQGRALPPKVAHRASGKVLVLQGNHGVKGLGWTRQKSTGLEILHYPLRSRDQYVRKIRQGGRAYSNNRELDPSVGITWRQQYAELCDTGSLAFIEENMLSADVLRARLSSGELVTDTRLADLLDAGTP